MPSTKGFAARRRGVRDSRPPPVHNDASGRSGPIWRSAHAGEAVRHTIDIALQGLTAVKVGAACVRSKRILPGSRRVDPTRAAGEKLLLPVAHFGRDPLSS
jgi:hypothetical protein